MNKSQKVNTPDNYKVHGRSDANLFRYTACNVLSVKINWPICATIPLLRNVIETEHVKLITDVHFDEV